MLAARIGRTRRTGFWPMLLALVLCICGLSAASAQASPVIDYPNFSGATGLQLNGVASLSGSSLQITPAQEFTSGTAWSRTEIQPAGSFETEFELKMHGSSTLETFGTYADGMAFVLQPNSAQQIGEPGGALGYVGISPSAVVQFDIYQNTYDPPVPYISFMENGNAETHLATSAAPLPFALYGETPVRAWIVYNATKTELSVYAAPSPAAKPATPLFTYKVNLAEVLHSEYAFAGFTAGTGSGDAVQEVLNWQLSSESPARTVVAPTVATLEPESVTQTSATLNGTVNPNSVEISECKFEYATAASYELTKEYASSTPCSSLPGSGTSPVAVSAALVGLTANTPYHFRIVATSVGGTSDGSDKTFQTLPNPPTVESISPNQGPTAGSTAVTIKGKGFLAGSTVTIGSAATAVTVVSETEITATTAATAAGAQEVIVSDAGGPSTGGPKYTYVAVPSVESITPTQGPIAGGTPVKIKGKGFVSPATVKIGSAATAVTVVSETEITATTAATAAGAQEVIVSDAGGSSTGGVKYTYVAVPTVSSIEPTQGPTAGSTAVKIKGKGFVAPATVKIGSAATAVTVVSETEITATTAATAAGAQEVIVSDAGGSSTGGVKYTYVAVPSVESITPTQGPIAGGTPVKIKGKGFVSPATVKIGSAATAVTVVSETEITAKTAANPAGAQEVIVTDAGGTSTLGPTYTYVAPPTVESISPTQGPIAGGTLVTIKGKGFLAGSTVTIGAAATAVTVVSEEEITAKTAAGSAGPQEVIVSDAGGPSAGGPTYTYVAVPSVESITPTQGPIAGGTPVKIKGKGFVSPATVKIGSAATAVTVVSETEITATTAATAAGAQEVIVSDAGGSSTGGVKYTYVAVPTVSSIEPTQGPTAGSTAVKIKGKGFVAPATVKIGSAATAVTVVSETEITATTAATAAGAQEVIVSDAGGSSTGGVKYTYVAVPTVESISPNQGPIAGGTSVTIKGKGFLAGSTVTIGSAATAVTVVSETEITATTAATAAGAQEVIVSDAGGPSTGGPKYTYVAVPSVESMTPNQGPTAGGTPVTIKGKGFVSPATVKIGSAATSVTVVSETEITATTAATAAGAQEVIVSDAGGSSTGGLKYTYVAVPTVSSIEPTQGPTAGSTAVKIKGKGFVAPATVKIGSAATAVTVVSETEITATTAATAAGAQEVIVSDAGGSSTGGPKYTYVAVPSVESITPTQGPIAGGTPVKIKGKGFVSPATVKIGSAATAVTVVSETEITAKTAANPAGAQEVIVTDAGGTSTLGPTYTYVAPPTVESISPTQGPIAGGTLVTIKGKGFLAGSTVTIGAAATAVTVVSEEEITAKTAAGSAGPQEVIVSDAGGPSAGGPTYTYVAVPSVESITPTQGPIAGGTPVKIKGKGFVSPATVKIGSAATAVTVVSETEITATTAATAAGAQEVIVSDAGGSSTGGVKYTYVAVPTVSSIEPTQGPTAGSTAVKIKGKGFVAPATVKIGSAATAVTVVSETEITATTAATAAGAQEVIVSDAGGSSTGGVKYTYVAVPTVESISPNQGPIAGGTSVTIKGKGFLAGSTVTIGSAATAVTVVSETEITATTAATAAGAQEVIVSDAGGTSTGGPKYTYVAVPSVESMTPNQGPTAGGTPVTIKGKGFVSPATVKIGSAATSVTVVSETEITATTAATAAAGAQEVIVSDAGGTSTAGPKYTYVPSPTVVSEKATAVTQTTATLKAAVNPNGGEVTKCEFEYGPTNAYGSTAPCAALPGSGTSPLPVSAAITGLTAEHHLPLPHLGDELLGHEQRD